MERIHDFVRLTASQLVSHPENLDIRYADDGIIRINAHRADIGSLMGKEGKHAKAIEALLRAFCDCDWTIHIGDGTTGDRDERRNGPKRTWTATDEAALKTRLESVLKEIDRDVVLKFIPAVGESVYHVRSRKLNIDTVNAVHVVFRAWGRRNDRYITIEMLPNEGDAT